MNTSADKGRLQNKLDSLPDSPGVYKMLAADGSILYIGKAKNLKNRVRSYFQKNLARQITRLLVKNIIDLDIIVTPSEKEALILENQLIKEYKPYFNIDLKDNKTYPYLQFSTRDKFPRLYKTRNPNKKEEYFGPFTDVSQLHHILNLAREVYPLKKCSRSHFPKAFKPCIYYHMGQCLPYCTGEVSQDEIIKLKTEIKRFLQGDLEELKIIIQEKMKEASERQNYERALELRDRLQAIEEFNKNQSSVVSVEGNFDAIEFFLSQGSLIFTVLQFRKGRLINKNNFQFENELFHEDPDLLLHTDVFKETYEQFLLQYYQQSDSQIEEIILNEDLILDENMESLLLEQIKKASGFQCKLVYPERGNKKRYLELAKSNARLSFYELIKNREKQRGSFYIKEFLKLPKEPQIIESFDIANLGQRAIVAGMVSFNKGKADKANYRIFNIRSLGDHHDDYQSMHEAVYRRYKRLVEENIALPDLILIDGGKGQLSAAKSALDKLNIKKQAIIALAKKEEEIFVPKLEQSIKIPIDNPGLKLIIAIRNETHRWVNSSHIRKRDKDELKSRFVAIRGFGPKKVEKLLKQIPSSKTLNSLKQSDIERLHGFSEKDKIAIKAHLNLSGVSKST